MTNAKKDLLDLLILESDHYSNLHDIEKLSDGPNLISAIPMQPLYLALKRSSYEQVSALLPLMSQEQRLVLLDLDLFQKDALDVNNFQFWIKAYCACKDLDVVGEFSRTEEFLLYLKSVANLYTFDVEDPEYPDHDNYFLTEDSLVLVEYSEEFTSENELQFLIKNLYSELGPTNAYKLLFKIISDSHMVLTEEVFQLKTDRLREYGFVDYYEALELRACFLNIQAIDKFVKGKKSITGNLEDVHKNQKLHSSVVLSFKTGLDNIHKELSELNNQKRMDYLQFNFVKLINSTIALENSLKEGSVALSKIGKVTKQMLELGHEYISYILGPNHIVNLFELFDFKDIFKIGYSLIHIEQKKLKKIFSKLNIDSTNDYFLGAYWNHYVDCSFEEVVKLADFEKTEGKIINSIETYNSWVSYNKLLMELLPNIQNFYAQITELQNSGKIADQYYLNYKVEDIDFEAIILTLFISFSCGKKINLTGLGLKIEEFNKFVDEYFDFDESEHNIKLMEHFAPKLKEFTSMFQLDHIAHIEIYLYQLIRDNLEGYNFNNIDQEDYKHIGGPIFLLN